MDDGTIGLALRRIRLRRDERQADVAARAGVTQSTYSLAERGHLDRMSLATLRRIVASLEIRLDLIPRWRGGDVDRLVNGRHAVMGAQVTDRLRAAGWEVAPEVSFNHFGERRVIDLLGWNAVARALLIVELKTEVVDANDLLATMDRRLRLGRQIARDRGWDPTTVSGWVVIADSRTNRRHVHALAPLLRSAFPEDGRAAAGWLRQPYRRHLALWFLTDSDPGDARRSLAPRKRVGKPRSRSRPAADPRQPTT